MAECSFKVGQKVQIVGKNLRGQVAYVGLTSFSPGKWIGVVLDEKDKGKNNGTIKGTTYFKCASNCGLFVRPLQLTLVIAKEADAMAESARREAGKISGMNSPRNEKSSAPTLVEKSAAQNQKRVTKSVSTIKAPSDTPLLQSPANCNTTGSSNGNILKATKINQPLQANQRVISSNTQLELSFSGATVSVAAPKRSKTSVSPSESFCCARQRSAFVETGFLEILHTQFTPGHPLRSPTVFNTHNGSPGGIAISPTDQLQQQKHQQHKCKELETINAKLHAELEDLQGQRMEDKRRLHELERVRLQKDQLIEFKAQIMEQHSLLQRDIQRCRQELREANDCKIKCKRELDEVAESIELLTLDKEMAEERAETLLIELETANERIEELSLDVEILRAENENSTTTALGGHSENESKDEVIQQQPTAAEIRRLEQYNKRLRETVVRLRDVLTHEKQDLQKANKELETKTSEIFELKKSKEILSKGIDVMEMHIIDLKEQVDAALGAESMVSSLAESKIELEDRVKLLEEEVMELEALEEIHEQIIEGNQELELDLREEIDALNSTIKMLQQEKNNTLETIYDRDVTIMKFRELVKTLNYNMLMKDQNTNALGTGTGTSTSDDLSTISNQDETQSIDFNQMFYVTKACKRAIDQQLNEVELKLCRAHIEHLLAFVPEEILLRGSEHDIILVLLLLQRMYEKLEIICHTIDEKFPSSCEFAKNAIFEGFSVHRFAFRCKCLFVLRGLKLVIKQLIFGLNHCDYEVCTHAAIYRGEIESQEKTVDELVNRLKGDMLDENTPMEAVERTLLFFNGLYMNLICSQNIAELVDEHQLCIMLAEVLDVCLDCIHTNAGILHTVIQLGDENTESFWAMQFLMENVNQLKQKLRKLQRKLTSAAVDNSGMQQLQIERIQHILSTNEQFGRFVNILTATTKDATKDIAACSFSNKEDFPCDAAIEHKKLWKIIITNSSKFAAEEKTSTPAAIFQHCIQLLDEQINVLANFVSENETLRSANKNTMFVRSSATTLLQRSLQLKQHSDDVKSLKHALVERDKEFKMQKYLAKMKQNEFSEMQVRKEIAERNLCKSQRNQEEVLTQIVDRIEHLDKLMYDRENVVAQSLNDLQEKISTMELNYARLEQNLVSRKQVINLTTDESYREIGTLNKCLRYERAERIKLQINEMKVRMRSFEPLHVPHNNKTMPSVLEARLNKELRTLKNQWILSHIKLKPNAEIERCALKRNSNELLQRAISTYIKIHPHRGTPSHFGSFGSKELNQIFH